MGVRRVFLRAFSIINQNFTNMFLQKSVVEALFSSFCFLGEYTFFSDAAFYFNLCAQVMTIDTRDFERVLAESIKQYDLSMPVGFMEGIHDALA